MSFAAVLSAVLFSSLSLKEAKSLEAHQAWDKVLLGAPLSKEHLSHSEVESWAKVLEAGCARLLKADPAMAFGLGQRSALFSPSVGAVCFAKAAMATDQMPDAEAALRSTLKEKPKRADANLLLGRVLLAEGDEPGAKAVLQAVPPRSKEHVEAQKLLKRIKTLKMAVRETPSSDSSGSLTYESTTGPGDIRVRKNALFAIKYFNNQRDFGQRASYEQRITDALSEAHDFAKSILGHARDHAVDVILYTKEEFALHFGAQTAMFIAGTYAQNAIRINDAVEINPQSKATLVHEYVHAIIDDYVAGRDHRLPTWINEGTAKYVEWRYQGFDHAPLPVAVAMRGEAAGHNPPSLQAMSSGALVQQSNPEVAYGASATAVKLLLARGGTSTFFQLLTDLGNGKPQDEALQRHYGITLADLQADLAAELTRR